MSSFRNVSVAKTLSIGLAMASAWGTTAAAADDPAALLNERMAYWDSRALLCDPRASGAGASAWKPFPSKAGVRKHPKDSNQWHEVPSGEYVTCDAGDALLFGGMLCLAGIQSGCQLVKEAQDSEGRWWRSPKHRVENFSDERVAKDTITRIYADSGFDENFLDPYTRDTFSHDQANGVHAYVLATNDRSAFENWVNWINRNDRCTTFCDIEGQGAPRYCLSDACVFKPADCTKFLLTGAILKVPVPFCANGAVPVTATEMVANRVAKLRGSAFGGEQDRLLAELPEYKAAKTVFNKVAQQAMDLARELDNKTAALSPARQLDLQIVADFLAANDSARHGEKHHSTHNLLLWILMLENLNRSDAKLHAIAQKHWGKQKQNPFFDYVANRRARKGNAMLASILKACPREDEDKNAHVRKEWIWERENEHLAWSSPKYSMYWDCILVGALWRNDAFPPNYGSKESLAQDLIQKKMALIYVMKRLVAIGDSLAWVFSPAVIGTDAEARVRILEQIAKKNDLPLHAAALSKVAKYAGKADRLKRDAESSAKKAASVRKRYSPAEVLKSLGDLF
jgi:hypothetical protein